MTPSETTDEKRSRSYWGFVLIGAVVIVAAAFILWPRADGRQQLSLKVLNYSTDSWAGATGTVVLARVAVTNETKETLVLGSGPSLSPRFLVLEQTKAGWKSMSPSSFRFHGFRPVPSKLLPGEDFTFEAVVPTNGPCLVGVSYLNDRLPAWVWQKLPPRLVAKLSWAPPWRIATTEVIDLSKPLK